MFADHLCHESGHGIWIEGLTPPADEDEIAAICPGRSGGQLVVGLMVSVFSQDGHCLAVDADYSGPAALGGPLNPLPADDGIRSAECNFSGVKVHSVPAQVKQLATAGAGIGRQTVKGE